MTANRQEIIPSLFRFLMTAVFTCAILATAGEPVTASTTETGPKAIWGPVFQWGLQEGWSRPIEEKINETGKTDFNDDMIFSAGTRPPFRRLSPALRHDRVPPMEKVWGLASGFLEFWSQYGIGTPPSIDFERESVAAVFLGPKPNAGYGVKIVSVTVSDGQTTIAYTRLLPNPERDYAAVITYPFDLVVFPRSLQDVRFQKTDATRHD